ncbi:hypothetical protein T459_26974 [Capsicum annuum]|uniref:Uncharacterized protein n=1 Tax=Capsicum annuum TaxID=4072 RepID=A0A2G2YCK6_CAPAN|nr:hypothetical protein T459_26974 [Capsicum annuum]
MDRREYNFHKIRLPKRDAVILKRQLPRLQIYLGEIKYMTGVIDIVIIVDQHEEYTDP